MLVKRLVLIMATLLAGLIMFTPQSAVAASRENCENPGERTTFLSFPTWYKYLNPVWTDGECQLTVPFPAGVIAILFAVLEILMRVGGIAAVFFIIYGGFLYMTSAGEPEKTKNGRTTIINAVIGIFIIMLAISAVNFIGGTVL